LAIGFIVFSMLSVDATTFHKTATVAWSTNGLVVPTAVDIGLTYNGFYYLADKTNFVVQVLDISTSKLISPLRGFAPTNNCSSHCGPNGIVAVPYLRQLWVGIWNSSVCVVSLNTNSVLTCISTRGTAGVDEMCYDARDKLVVVANPDDPVPFITFISAVTRQIVASMSFPDALDGLEQPVWNSVDGLIYQSVPSTVQNPGGEVKVIDPKTFTVVKILPQPKCNSKGMIFGRDAISLFIECGNKNPTEIHFIVMNVSSGKTISDIPGYGDGDEVAYNPKINTFFSTPYPKSHIGKSRDLVIFQAGAIVQTIAVDKISHTVAVDSVTGNVYLPLSKGVGIFSPS